MGEVSEAHAATIPVFADFGELAIRHQGHIKAVLLFASTMTAMSGAIIAPALPGISRHFPGQPDVMIQLILTLPALMITLFSPLMGYLTDRFGRKRLLLLTLFIYGLAGFAGFLVDRVDLLLASRALMGISVAGILSISTTLIGDYFDASERARFLGLQSSFMAMGGVVFLNLGGALSDWSWRGPFLVYLSGIVLLPYAWAVLVEPRRDRAQKQGEQARPVAVDFWRTGTAYSMGLISMALFYVFPAQLPFLLSENTDISGLEIGLAISAAPLTSSLVSFSYGYLKRFISVVMFYVWAFLLSAIGFLVVGMTESYSMTVVGAAMAGLGFGVFMPNTTVWLMRITPESARGRVFGGFSSTFFLGQFISPLIVAPVAFWLASLRDVFIATAVLCCLLAGFMAVLGVTLLRADRRL